jgi:phage nucleotide-binding protein
MTNENKGPRTLPKLYKPSSTATQAFGICIYGRGGTGKTTLVGTMPGKGLIIDVPQIEGGTFVLEDKAANIDVVPVETWNDVDGIYWYLRNQRHDYRWVAIDSITAFQELAKRKVVSERDLSADPHVIALQEWGKMGQLVGDLVYRFRTLPVHTIWIAQERKHGSEEGGSVTGPDIIPSALSALMPSMMLVGRLSVQQDAEGKWQRQLRVGSHPDYYTKVRAKPGLDVPSLILKPDLGNILRFLLGSGPAPESAEEALVVFA